MSELLFKPAAELATLVHTGQISSAELVGASLERIEALQPTINAFTHVDADGALATAEAIGRDDPRPFAGRPDRDQGHGGRWPGMPFTMGSDIFGDFVPGHDAYLVRRMREAGFVIVGKTNMPEFGILPVTESRRFGPARNPWDTDRTPGGSSGGAAAAVAAGDAAARPRQRRRRLDPDPGVVLRARRPEAHARAHLAAAPTWATTSWSRTACSPGPWPRPPRCSTCCAGYEIGDATWAPPPSEPFAAAAAARARQAPDRLHDEGADRGPPRPALRAGRPRRGAAALASSGTRSRSSTAPWGDDDLLQTFTMVFGTPIADGHLLRRAGHRAASRPPSWSSRSRGASGRASASGPRSTTCSRARSSTRISRGIVALWETYDVVLTPALAERPVPIGEIDACSDDPWEDFRRSGQFTPYTAMFNVTGQPAISVPLFHGDDGLPTAVQLAGRPADEGDAPAASPPSSRPPVRGPTAGPSWPPPRQPAHIGSAACGTLPTACGTARTGTDYAAAPERLARRAGGATGVSYAHEPLGHTTEDAHDQAGPPIFPGSSFETLVEGPGAPRVVRRSRGARRSRAAPTGGSSLAYFAQLTDFQLADEESPARVEFVDKGPTSAFRPQEAFQPWAIDYSFRQLTSSPPRARTRRAAERAPRWTSRS